MLTYITKFMILYITNINRSYESSPEAICPIEPGKFRPWRQIRPCMPSACRKQGWSSPSVSPAWTTAKTWGLPEIGLPEKMVGVFVNGKIPL